MGADITFESENGQTWYFRDAYNDCNLAWVIDLSYWQSHREDKGEQLVEAKAFFEKLANIKNEEITTYAMNKELGEGIVRTIFEKRDAVKGALEFIRKSVSVVWSV